MTAGAIASPWPRYPVINAGNSQPLQTGQRTAAFVNRFGAASTSSDRVTAARPGRRDRRQQWEQTRYNWTHIWPNC